MRTYSFFLLLISVFCFSLWPGAAAADDPADSLAAGRQAMAVGDFDSAYQSFLAFLERNPAHPEINFLLGRAAFESGRYEEAVMAFERVLMSNPDAARAKLELARSYMRLGSNEIARQYFQEVLATNPPEPVWQNIQRFLAAIDDAEKRHFISGMVSLGGGYDDNVRSAPGNFYFYLFDDTVSLKETDSYLFNTNLVVNHVYRRRSSSPHSWRTSFTNYNTFHDSDADMDVKLFGLSTGPAWRSDKTLIQGSLVANRIDLGAERYLRILGISTAVTRIVSQNWAFNAGLSFQNKEFHQDGDKDSTNLAINAGPVFNHGKNRLGLVLGYEREDADVEDNNSFDRYRVSLRYDYRFSNDTSIFLSYRFQQTEYQGVSNLVLPAVKRQDDVIYYNAGLSRVFWRGAGGKRSLTGQVSYTGIDADSNVDLYSYTRNIANLALTYAF